MKPFYPLKKYSVEKFCNGRFRYCPFITEFCLSILFNFAYNIYIRNVFYDIQCYCTSEMINNIDGATMKYSQDISKCDYILCGLI